MTAKAFINLNVSGVQYMRYAVIAVSPIVVAGQAMVQVHVLGVLPNSA